MSAVMIERKKLQVAIPFTPSIMPVMGSPKAEPAPPRGPHTMVVKALFGRGFDRGLADAVMLRVRLQREALAVECRERRAMADRDDSSVGQPLLQQPIELGFGRLVERGGGLGEGQEVRLLPERARDAEPLLLAERQLPVPVRLLVEPQRKRGKPDRLERLGEVLAAVGRRLG